MLLLAQDLWKQEIVRTQGEENGFTEQFTVDLVPFCTFFA